MTLGFYFVEDVLNLSIRTNDKRRAHDAHHFFPVHVLLLENTECVSDLLVDIGK